MIGLGTAFIVSVFFKKFGAHLALTAMNIRYIEKFFSVCRDEKVIDDVRNRVAAYEDSVRHHYEMVEMAAYKDSIANKLLQESKSIKRAIKSPK